MHKISLLLRRAIIAVGVGYCLALLGLTVAWSLIPEQPWWLGLLNTFALLLFLPLLVLAPVSLLARSGALRGGVLVTMLVFLASFHTALLPPREPSIPSQAITIRVATFNHLFSNENTDGIIAAIRAQQADVVALQELSTPVAEQARLALSNEYPYQFFDPAERANGLGLMSRYPIESIQPELAFRGQRAVVRVNNQLITVINAHPNTPFVYLDRRGIVSSIKSLMTYGTGPRQRQMQSLLETIDRVETPLVVMGDLNTSDRDPLYAELDARLHDVYRKTAWGFGFTFPNPHRANVGRFSSPFPLVRIDYIWASDHFQPAAAYVECRNGGSDHCMLVADVTIAAT
jgi:endonuclease/exonuclease/phosphatase (EEP) superfamily protein YafD